MHHVATATIKGLWTFGMLACLAIGVQAVGDKQARSQAIRPVNGPSLGDSARPKSKQIERQQVDATDQVPDGKHAATPMTYGPDGTFITLEEYYKLHPGASPRYRSNEPRPKWQYRPPTCSPSRAQIAWAKSLPNYDGLVRRGLSDEQMVSQFAPSEVKALEGEELPEHLRPDLNPQVVFINERCKDGTCTTGYCEASKRNNPCKSGVCPVPRR